MGLWDWLGSLVEYLQQLWQKKQGTLVMLGLDNAGKTTLLQMLIEGRLGQNQPTNHANRQEAAVGNVTFTAIDVGGHLQMRRMWRDFCAPADAVVFLIDASDTSRFSVSKRELDSLLADEQLQSTPVLILGNKIDISTAASEHELKTMFDLHRKTTGKTLLSWRDERPQRPVEVFMCSVAKRQGYGEAFRWLMQFF